MDLMMIKLFYRFILIVSFVPNIYCQTYSFLNSHDGANEYINSTKIIEITDSTITLQDVMVKTYHPELKIISQEDLVLPLSTIIEIQKTHSNDFGVHKKEYSYLQGLTCGPIIGSAVLFGGGLVAHALWRQIRSGSTEYSEDDIGIVFVGYPVIAIVGAVYGGYKFHTNRIGFRIGFRKENYYVRELSIAEKKTLLLELYRD